MKGMDAKKAQRLTGAVWVVLILCLTALVQVWFAAHKGLVLDEFHSHFHATRTSWGLFWDTLTEDNHPPLSFLLISASTWLCGDDELALRAPAMLFALAEISLLWRLARDHGRGSAGLAAAFLAASSLHLDFATQARMYALHSLAVTGAVIAVVRLLQGESRRRNSISLGLWLWIGLHNHYFFAQYSVGLAFGVGLAACIEPSLKARLGTLVKPIVAAGLLALPWYLSGFPAQWGHALPPGGDDLGLQALLEAYVHLFFLNVRLGTEVPLVGGFLRETFIACGGLLTLLAVLGACRGLAPGSPRATRMTTAIMSSVAFVVPCAALLLAHVIPRAGFTWHYVLPSAAAEAWLIALGWRCVPKLGLGFGLHRIATCAVLSAATLLCLLNAVSQGTEDYPGAVADLLEQHQPQDLIVCVEWQPALFPQGMPWDYYAPRLRADPPPRLPMNQNSTLRDPRALDRAPRLLLLKTALPDQQHLPLSLKEAGFVEVQRSDHGFGIQVILYIR